MNFKVNAIRFIGVVAFLFMALNGACAQEGYQTPELKPVYKDLAVSVLNLVEKATIYDTIRADKKQKKAKKSKVQQSETSTSKSKSHYQLSEVTISGVRITKRIDEAVMSQANDSLAKMLRMMDKEGDFRSILAAGRFFMEYDNHACTKIFYDKLVNYDKTKDSLFVPVMMFLGDFNLKLAESTVDRYDLIEQGGRDYRNYERQVLKKKYADDTITYRFLLDRYQRVVNNVNQIEGEASSFYLRILDEIDSMYLPALKGVVEAGHISNYEGTIPFAERVKSIAPNDYVNNLYLADMYFADAKYVNSDYYRKVADVYADYFATVPKVRDSIQNHAINNYHVALAEIKDYQTLSEFSSLITPLCRENEIFPYSFKLEAAAKKLEDAGATFEKEEKAYRNDSIGLAKEGLLAYLEKSPNYLKAIDAYESAKKEAKLALAYVQERQFPDSVYSLSDYKNAFTVETQLEDYKAAIASMKYITDMDSLRWFKRGYELIGNLYVMDKDYDQAVECYRVVMRADSATSMRMYGRIAQAYNQGERVDEAVQAWLEFYEKFPENKNTFVNISEIYRKANRFNEAVESYGKYIELCADSVEAKDYFNYAELCRQAYEKTDDEVTKNGFKLQAKSLYQKTLTDAGYSNRYLSLFLLGFLSLGDENDKNAPTEESTGYFEEALELWPEGKGASTKFNAAILTTQYYCFKVIAADESNDKDGIRKNYPLARKYSDLTVQLNANHKNTLIFKNYLDDMKKKHRLR